MSLSAFVIIAHEVVTEVVVVISKQVILLPADKAQSLCLDLAVDIDQKLLRVVASAVLLQIWKPCTHRQTAVPKLSYFD